jgi:ribosomal protein S26
VRNFSFPVADKNFKKSARSRIITWCVSVAVTPRGVAVRDTKDRRKRTLFFTHNEWKAFVAGVKDGEFG